MKINMIGANKRGSYRTARGPYMLLNPYPVYLRWNKPADADAHARFARRARRRTSVVERLADRGRWPRSWWYPLVDPLLFTDDAHRQKYHDETSKALRTAVFTLLVFSFFCALTLGAPDAELLSAAAKIKVPFANVDIGFGSFLLVGPLVLISMMAYVHIFLGHLRRVEPPPPKLQLPVLFNLPYRSARVIASLLFYAVGPFVLLLFARKAYPRPSGVFFVTLFGAGIVWMLFLLVRREDPERRAIRVPVCFAVMVVVTFVCAAEVVLMVARRVHGAGRDSVLTSVIEWPFRTVLHLGGAQLANADLAGFDLRGANLSGARLVRADLTGALLTNANLTGADLQGANLDRTRLDGARMQGVKR